MKITTLFAMTVVMATAAVASVKGIIHVGPNSAPIAGMVVVSSNSDFVFVSGQTSAPREVPHVGDTQAQTVATLTRVQELLKTRGMTLGDVVMLRVYLLGVPEKEGHADLEGMSAAYKQFFGTADQPNKPARTTIQVAGIGDVGENVLVEIDAQAAKAR